jgi:DNA-binding LacI/PurR family transcriptional regulator
LRVGGKVASNDEELQMVPDQPKAFEPHRRATIKEVAEAAGVSRSTASRALGGNGYVAEPVRARVRNAAKRLGYVVDVTARSLKQQSSRLIGVVVSDLKNPFYAGLASGAAQAARAAGYTTVLIDDRDGGSEESAAAEAALISRSGSRDSGSRRRSVDRHAITAA